MKINKKKMDIILARECKTVSALRAGTSPQTLAKIQHGGSFRPSTVGRIAKELGVDVTELIESEA